MLYLILAQADPISGGGGWVGAGLLGAVLAWLLLVHLPSKDKQLREFIESKDKHIQQLVGDFKVSLELVVKHCEAENDKILAELRHVRDGPKAGA